MLYVSHRLDEILDLCQRVTVFRDGRSVAELAGPTLTRSALVEAIVGRAIEAEPKRAQPRQRAARIVLSARAVCRASAQGHGRELRSSRGEVLGLGGLVGAGRSELARLIFGADRPDAGAMLLGRASLCAEERRRGGQGGHRLRAGGAPRPRGSS